MYCYAICGVSGNQKVEIESIEMKITTEQYYRFMKYKNYVSKVYRRSSSVAMKTIWTITHTHAHERAYSGKIIFNLSLEVIKKSIDKL